MFAGFPSTNTPAIQVWDFFSTFASTSANRSVFLPDDCAPIQYFKTGATNGSAIQLFLPTAPIEGKQIKIVNANYTNINQLINVYSADANGAGTTNPFIVIGSGQTLDLCYSKNFIYVNANGQFNTGWVSLNQSPIGAYAFNAVVLGGNNNSSTNARSSVIGGSNNTAIGSSSTIVGGVSNTAGDYFAAVIGGSSNTASGYSSSVVGSLTSVANITAAAVIGGSDAIASGVQSVVIGGSFNRANAEDSVVLGTKRAITRSINPLVVIASGGPLDTTNGTSQSAALVLAVQTTDATVTTLRSNVSAAGTTNQVILPNNSAYYFKGSVIANVTGGGNTKAWTFEGAIKRGANAASTTMVQSVINPVASDSGAETWTITLAADTTNGGLQVQVTGQASTTIRWVCKVETTEVTY